MSRNLDLDLNVKIRILSTDRVHTAPVGTPLRTWLIRAEILSGGLVLPNADDLDPQNRVARVVWAIGADDKSKLKGLLFSGSELQAEIEDKIPGQDRRRRFRLLGVRRGDAGAIDESIWEQTTGQPIGGNNAPQPPFETIRAQLSALHARCKDLNIAMLPEPVKSASPAVSMKLCCSTPWMYVENRPEASRVRMVTREACGVTP